MKKVKQTTFLMKTSGPSFKNNFLKTHEKKAKIQKKRMQKKHMECFIGKIK